MGLDLIHNKRGMVVFWGFGVGFFFVGGVGGHIIERFKGSSLLGGLGYVSPGLRKSQTLKQPLTQRSISTVVLSSQLAGICVE